MTPSDQQLREAAERATNWTGANIQRGRKGFVKRPWQERFWEKVDRRGPDECWPWLASGVRGYGTLVVDGRHRMASHLSWEIANGQPFPAPLNACHSCDNPACVNPAHLWPGTDSDNMLDASRKGRLIGRGVRPPNAFCRNGHPMEGNNVVVWAQCRLCRTCKRAREERNKADRLAASVHARLKGGE